MKFIAKATAGLASLGLFIAASAEDAVKFNVPGVSSTPAASQPAAAPAAPAAAPAAKPAAKFTEAQVAEAYGWYMGAQMGLRQLEFSKAEIDAFARGLQGVAAGAQPSFDPKEMGPELQAFLGKKQDSFMSKLRVQNMQANLEFFSKLKQNKAIVELPSGLCYEITKPATGAPAKAGQIATIHYTGALVNGQVFDSSVERGQPVELLVKAASAESPQGIIAGMYEGLLKVGVGGKAKLYIPPSLGYGDAGNEGIPPGAALIFEIEVVSVKDAPKDAPAAK